MNRFSSLLVTFLLAVSSTCSFGRDVGDVSTTFNLLTPNNKIVIHAFEDPKVSGITCFVSRAKKGGFTGAVGLAEDTSDASVACRQTGKISFQSKIGESEKVFKESASILFKTVQVVRLYDSESNSLVYLVYSDKLVDGSPKNSISAVWLDNVRPLK